MSSTDSTTAEIARDLVKNYGEMIAASDVWKILGYRSIHGYRKARARKTLSVTEYKIPGRRGKYVLTRELIQWFDSLATK